MSRNGFLKALGLNTIKNADLGLENFNGASETRHVESISNAKDSLTCHCEPERRKGVAILGYRKVAFTLAEVLITLGIIGVVAALTIPTLMQKTGEKETVSKVKKNVKIFQDAFDFAVLEYGTLDKWDLLFDDLDSSTLILERLKPYLKIQTICEPDSCNEYPLEQFYVLKGVLYPTEIFNMNNARKIILADGTVAIIRALGASNYIFIDTNGKKAPNTLGKDIFNIYFNKDGKISYYPNVDIYGLNPSSTSWESCNPRTSEGWACTAWIMTYENMDYLRCADDLRWDGPTKCP